MKTILALTLAAVMAAGMTTVAFAEAVPVLGATIKGGENKMFTVNEDNEATAVTDDVVKSGDVIYVPVVMEDGGEYSLPTSDDVAKLNYYFESDLNDGADQDGDLVRKKLNGNAYYCAVIEVPENNTSKNQELVGTLAIGRSKRVAMADDNTNKMEISLVYGPKSAETVPDSVTRIDGDWDIDDTVGIVDFSDADDEIALTFGDIAEFEVDVTGQGRLNLAWNTKFDGEFAAYYDYANIDFLTFTGEPEFNKTGTLYIYADEDAFIYRKGAEGAEAVNAKWNEDYEAWEIRTRKLDSFVISDVELDEKTITEDNSSSATEDGNKQNPDTGR